MAVGSCVALPALDLAWRKEVTRVGAFVAPSRVLDSVADALGQDLSGVELRPYPEDVPDHAPLALSIGETILLSRLAGELPEAGLRMLLAHESAHVIQRRNARSGACGASAAALEAEAHAAAVAALQGRRHACLLADAEDEQPRAWGVAGHYYTAYLMMLAAGLDNPTAYTMAFYAQMPDQVRELDAVVAGYEIMTRRTLNTPGDDLADRILGDKTEAKAFSIQTGLHCLTGRPSSEETSIRRRVLENAGIGTLEFGLAIHPYGDSFAHRVLDDPGRMYSAPLGHSVEIFSKREHAPDFIHVRPELYREYGMSLYDIVCTKQKGRSGFRPLIGWNETESLLKEIAGQAGDNAQITRIREISEREACQFMHAYRPENEQSEPKADWASFHTAHPRLGPYIMAPNTLDKCRAFAQEWSK